MTDGPPLRSAVEPSTPTEPSQPSRPTEPSQPTQHARPARFRAWVRGPGGRFAVPVLSILAVLAATGSAGAYLTRAIAPLPGRSPTGSQSASPADPPVDIPATTAAPTLGPQPSTNPTGAPASAPAQTPRPQDALAAWAQRISTAVDIPQTALRAYGYATLRLANDKPGCHLAWTTLAAIGKVESDHGRANGTTLQPDGSVLPPIIGPALNGQGGLKLVRDTDGGKYDGDPVYDHAVGPMQFIPGTWQTYQVDGDGDGVADPNDINDASLAAANYLCAGGRDLATSGGWWGAVLSYNAIQQYAQTVFNAANTYGQRARTVA